MSSHNLLPGAARTRAALAVLLTLLSSTHALLTWTPCTIEPLPRGAPPVAFPRPDLVECASLNTTLDSANPHLGGPQVTLFVQRIRSDPTVQSRGDLWFLNGGPGSATTTGYISSFLAHGGMWAAFGGSITLYFPDYRGLGRSTPLLGSRSCAVRTPDDRVEISSFGCALAANARWGADVLNYYSTTHVARDLSLLMRTVQAESGDPSRQTTALGTSWGTFVLNRLLQLPADLQPRLDRAIFDGVCAPDQCRTLDMGIHTDMISRAFLNSNCVRDATCAAKLGVDPVGRWQTLQDEWRAGRPPACAADSAGGVTRAELRTILGGFVGAVETRVFLPAVLYRFMRCDAERDVPVIKRLVDAQRAAGKLPPSDGGDESDLADLLMPPGDSLVFQLNVEYSEHWEFTDSSVRLPTSRAEVDAQFEHLLFGQQLQIISPRYMVEGYSIWPRYSDPEGYFLKIAQKNADVAVEPSILILNGDLDQASPHSSALLLEKALRRTFTRVRSVVVPFASHTTLGQSPTTNGLFPCGATMVVSFVTGAPSSVGGISCLQFLTEPDFAGTRPLTRGYAEQILGTPSLWGDADDAPPGRSSTSPPTERPAATKKPKTAASRLWFVWLVLGIGATMGCALFYIRRRVAQLDRSHARGVEAGILDDEAGGYTQM